MLTLHSLGMADYLPVSAYMSKMLSRDPSVALGDNHMSLSVIISNMDNHARLELCYRISVADSA